MKVPNLESNPGMPCLPAKPTIEELGLPLEMRNGVNLLAGESPTYGAARLAVLIGGALDPAPIEAAASTAAKVRAEAQADLDRRVAATPEAAALAAAEGRLADGHAELARVRERLAEAKAAYEAAIARSEDPRSLRPAIQAAELEVTDVERWVNQLVAVRNDARTVLEKARASTWSAIRAEHIGTLPARREQLREKAEAAVIDLAAELLEIDAMENAFAK